MNEESKTTYAYSDNGHSENPDLKSDESQVFPLGLLKASTTLHK